MALSGIQIFKSLPKTNCKDCGYPTCMAFALQVGAGKVELEACPHLPSEVRADLVEMLAPPVRLVEIGPADEPTVVGGETVLYRHEKRFEHMPALAVLAGDALDDDGFQTRLAEFRRLRFDRVGETLRPRLLAVASTDRGRLKARVQMAAEVTGAGIVIVSDDPEALREAGAAVGGSRPLLCGADASTFEAVAAVAKRLSAPFVLKGAGLRELADLGSRALDAGFRQVVLEPVVRTAGDALAAQVFLRRSAIRDKVGALGFPIIAFPGRFFDEPLLKTVLAAASLAKYAGIVVVDTVDPAHILPLLALAQGLYTDPQKPMMVQEGVYPVGAPGRDSPVLVTTNFSLTYYTVVDEIENSRVPAWLLVMDAEGQSVLTAWAAGKFVAETMASFVKKSGIEERIDHRTLIIPGHLAGIQADVETELGDWQVTVGAREAAEIPRFLRMFRSS